MCDLIVIVKVLRITRSHTHADMTAKKLDNALPLHDAAIGGHVEVAKILLRYMEEQVHV